jgi:hypothetical protein
MPPDRILSIHLTLEEGNLLLEALAELPFKTVFELIGKLNHQANESFADGGDDNQRQKFLFTEIEMALTIKALGEIPYNRVHFLLANLNKQIHVQLNGRDAGKAATEYADL